MLPGAPVLATMSLIRQGALISPRESLVGLGYTYKCLQVCSCQLSVCSFTHWGLLFPGRGCRQVSRVVRRITNHSFRRIPNHSMSNLPVGSRSPSHGALRPHILLAVPIAIHEFNQRRRAEPPERSEMEEMSYM